MRRVCLYFLTFAVCIAAISCISPEVRESLGFPVYMSLVEGEVGSIGPRMPFDLHISADQSQVVKVNDHVLGEDMWVQAGRKISIEPLRAGIVNLEMELFGLIPVRRIAVSVFPKASVVVGGHSIGVLLASRGVIVSDYTSLVDVDGRRVSPGKAAGIQIGDVIVEVDGVPVDTVEDVERELNAPRLSDGRERYVTLTVMRRGQQHLLTVKPALCDVVNGVSGARTRRYRLGLYVRDSAAGVGTLTFYRPETGEYGALGHSITDITGRPDTDIADGQIVRAYITGVSYGASGRPGEKMGTFDGVVDVLGDIRRNTDCGIYGLTRVPLTNPIYSEPIPVASVSEVREGPAKMLTVVSGATIEEFDIVIEKIQRQSKPDTKGLVIRVTDPRLIARTGGIVQGMSGSPIVQDGKLVGAVTHVLVSDPTSGYGILAEWMLLQTQGPAAELRSHADVSPARAA